MEHFTEEHSNFFLSKEWLVKTDNKTSTPYLIKFYSSPVDLSCCVLLTDTKSVWAEVLTGKQFARRWRDCNSVSPPLYSEAAEEDVWRTTHLDLLSRAHTLGGFASLSFEAVESNYADFAFKLECEAFEWRWEACFLGHKSSAEIISKHLVFPLISVNHLVFSSAEATSELSDSDIEKAVDKVGRTARRTVDTHIKNAISKPRVATTLRRMTATFNFIPELPPIISTAEIPDLHVHLPDKRARSRTTIKHRSISPSTIPSAHILPDTNITSPEHRNSVKPSIRADSATESEPEEPVLSDKHKSSTSSAVHSVPAKSPASDSDSSPARPAKKTKKLLVSSDDDSEEERKRRVAQLKSGSGPGGPKRGTRQPLKRGGKRF